MERWLSRSRVLLGLCAVLLVAALNRQDPMVYGMFLFMAVVSLLGFALPWMSLRSMRIKTGLRGADRLELLEGEASPLQLEIERRSVWPAFMVNVETRWRWAGRDLVLRQTVPMVRRGRPLELGRQVRFPCRGNYQLMAVSLSSGFPLGLIRASHTVVPDDVSLLVLPRAQPVAWPAAWNVSEDPTGELTTRHVGQSFELGALRRYQLGEPMGRVNWRASARAGELVIQHFQQSGSVSLRLVAQIPSAREVGDPGGAAEQVLRMAAGVAQQALAQGVRLLAGLSPHHGPLREMPDLLRSLAAAVPDALNLPQAIALAAQDMANGEQLAVVVAADFSPANLLKALDLPALRGRRVVVFIATSQRPASAEVVLAAALKAALSGAGFLALTEPA
jgi:uncharacterized protein (DUF58 family)